MENTLTLTAGSNEARVYEQPPLGEHKAVLVDIILSRDEMTKYGIKDILYFYFELEVLMDDNRPFLVRKKFNNSLNEKSNLYKFLTKWRGKPFAAGEEFDLNTLVGAGCVLEIEPWTTPDGDVLHLVDRARTLDKANWIAASGNYDSDRTRQRIEDRKLEDQPYAQEEPTPAPAPKKAAKKKAKVEVSEDDVPF
tara:strand:- start:1210 stop:1791 length:582 start_codon:yes stop_codon:yes gene_type:complete